MNELVGIMIFIAVDTNLIQLDTDELDTGATTYADNDDDLIFEVISIVKTYRILKRQSSAHFCYTINKSNI
jgi:hypothetical protein